MKHLQSLTYKILESKAVRYVALCFILSSISAIMLSSFVDIASYKLVLFSITYFTSLTFLLEYVARIITAPLYHPEASAFKAIMKYVLSFFGFVDLLAMLPCVLAYMYWDTDMIHLVTLPYIFTIFKLIRHMKSFRVIADAVATVKDELITSYTVCFVIICFASILMFYIEHDAQPEAFRNIGDGLWWAIVTFTTTGYGDIYPITPLGKVLGSIISMVGISMIALPTGIIGSAFMTVAQKRHQKQNNEETKTQDNNF